MEGGSRAPAGNLTQDDAQAIVESFRYPLDTIPPGDAAGRPHKRRDSLLVNHVPSVIGGIDGRDGKRSKIIDTGGGSGPTDGCWVHQFQRSIEESQLPSSSGHPTETARGNVMLDNSGNRQNVQHHSLLPLDGVKHKVFISHSGAQKDFAEQLCVDLESRGYLCPFFDQRQHSLPKGKDFVPLIKEAARHCHVAVMVLSEEFLCSKWPMIELAEFHDAQQAENPRLNMLPLFYKLSVKDLSEKAIAERWMPKWEKLYDEDARIDLAEWSGAVRALRKVNGEVFGKKGLSEVAYRKDIVQSIFRLSPPDLLFGSSRKMVGYSRVCQMVRDQFVRGTSGGPSFLGLYGAIGVGKTTLSKALCDEFCGEYMGRVCHVDLGEGQRMDKAWDEDWKARRGNAKLRLRRVKRMLERLCGLGKETLDKIIDVEEGLMELERHMKREPVFLAIDNVTDENSSWNEAHEYLGFGFHPESRIVITSRSIANVRDLVLDIPYCVAMPSLSWMEAGELFLRSAAPSKNIFGLTIEEQRIVGLCIEECTYYDVNNTGVSTISGEDEVGLLLKVHVHNVWGKSFHPMALSALGDFFRRYFSNNGMLRWTGYLEENKDPLWDVWKLRDGIGGIFGLQFHSLPSSEQLLFLDIAIFQVGYLVDDCHLIFTTLCDLHGETEAIMNRRLQDLERSGIIRLSWEDLDDFPFSGIKMHDIYLRFADWHMTNHGDRRLKNAQCVFKSRGFTSNGSNVASDMVRLQMLNVGVGCARVLTSKMMEELHNLEVLVLDYCPGVKELNLEGLVSLWYLLIGNLDDLERVTLSGRGGTAKNGGIFDSLRCVCLWDLRSLVHGPDIRQCTSLCRFEVMGIPNMTNMDGLECPHLKTLELHRLVGHQLASLPNVKALCGLGEFSVSSRCSVVLSDVEASRGVQLRDLGKPYLRVVEELVMYLCTEWVVNTTVNIQQMSSFNLRWKNNDEKGECLYMQDSSGVKYEWGDYSDGL